MLSMLCLQLTSVALNNAVNSDAFFVRYAHYECVGYGWR